MTVKEFIESNYGKNIKIGFTNGFVYCDIDDPEVTLSEVKQLSDNYIKECDDKIKFLESYIEVLSDDTWANNLIEKHSEKVLKLRNRLAKALIDKEQKNYNIEELKIKIANYEEKRLMRALDLMKKNLIKNCSVIFNTSLEYRNTVAMDILNKTASGDVKGLKTIKDCQKKISKIESIDYDEIIKNLRKDIEYYSDTRFNSELEAKRKIRAHSIKQKKDQIAAIKQSKKNFVPYLEAKEKEIYEGINGTIIFISKDNSHISGKYWDADDYRNRFKKTARQYDKADYEGDGEHESVDSLLQFFASEYGQLLMGKIHPEFIIEQLLNAEIYLVY